MDKSKYLYTTAPGFIPIRPYLVGGPAGTLVYIQYWKGNFVTTEEDTTAGTKSGYAEFVFIGADPEKIDIYDISKPIYTGKVITGTNFFVSSVTASIGQWNAYNWRMDSNTERIVSSMSTSMSVSIKALGPTENELGTIWSWTGSTTGYSDGGFYSPNDFEMTLSISGSDGGYNGPVHAFKERFDYSCSITCDHPCYAKFLQGNTGRADPGNYIKE
jgi:hypothetical protein